MCPEQRLECPLMVNGCTRRQPLGFLAVRLLCCMSLRGCEPEAITRLSSQGECFARNYKGRRNAPVQVNGCPGGENPLDDSPRCKYSLGERWNSFSGSAILTKKVILLAVTALLLLTQLPAPSDAGGRMGYAGPEIDPVLTGFLEHGVWYFPCYAPTYPCRIAPRYMTYGPPPVDCCPVPFSPPERPMRPR